jgi:hypothetical protein
LRSRIASSSGLPREIALPTTNRSGSSVSCPAVVALDQFDALLLELGAHRRIDIGIATGDAMPGGAREQRDAAHEGAADAEDVDMHEAVPWNNRQPILPFAVRRHTQPCRAASPPPLPPAMPGAPLPVPPRA